MWWSWGVEKFGIRVRIEIKCAKGVLFSKVDAEVGAPGISRLPVEQVEVPLDIEISKAVLDTLVTQILIVGWEVFGGRGWSVRTCHCVYGVVDKTGALVKGSNLLRGYRLVGLILSRGSHDMSSC
jgi:hypothetical protein